MTLTLQNLLKAKHFGETLQGTLPVQHRQKEWRDLVRGKERAIRLIAKSTLGVPTAHHGEQSLPMWSFAFKDGGILTLYVHKGNQQIQMVSRNEEESPDVCAAVDFLLAEFTDRLRQV